MISYIIMRVCLTRGPLKIPMREGKATRARAEKGLLEYHMCIHIYIYIYIIHRERDTHMYIHIWGAAACGCCTVVTICGCCTAAGVANAGERGDPTWVADEWGRH